MSAVVGRRRVRRTVLTMSAVLACLGWLLVPVAAQAEPDADPATGAESLGAVAAVSPLAANPAETIETITTVSFPVVGSSTIYRLGVRSPVSATVARAVPADAADAGNPQGRVEFFDGERSLGVVEVGADGRASIDTDAWGGSGARTVIAVFIPEQGSPWGSSTSAAKIYRLVDTSRVVPDIALSGSPVATVSDAGLEWTIANIWFSNFSVGFEREAVSGDVSLADVPLGTTIEEKQRYYFRPFTFSRGSGATDAAGNRVIEFTGTARLTSGSGNRWDFADPRLHIDANGDGYLTAEFSGFYNVGAEQSYGPVRVAIATFSGAQVTVDAAGGARAEIELNWEGQAQGAGTWANGFDSSFPNEFVALLNPGINLFFAGSGVATDASKRPHPITLSFTETALPVVPSPGVVPVFTAQPAAVRAGEGERATFSVAVSGTPAPSLQWQRRASESEAWADIAGATGVQLVLPAVELGENGAQFRAVATSAAGIAESGVAELTVVPTAPVLTDDNTGGFEDAGTGAEGTGAAGGSTVSGARLSATGSGNESGAAGSALAFVLLAAGALALRAARRSHRG